MTKRTLIEQMESSGVVPKSWINEVKRMINALANKNNRLEEYLQIVDNLAQEKEVLITKLDVAHYQIIRAVAQLSSPDELFSEEDIDRHIDIMESVNAQLKSYLETMNPELTTEASDDAKITIG